MPERKVTKNELIPSGGERLSADRDGGGVKGANWENEYKAASQLDEPEAYQIALESAEAAMKAALGDNDVEEYKRIKVIRDHMKGRLGTAAVEINLAEVQRQYDELMNPMRYGTDVRARQAAARRWQNRFGISSGVTQEMKNDIQRILTEVPGKALEIEPDDEMKTEIRMTMIKELGVSSAGDPGQKCEAFIRQQVNKLGGVGKTHFEANYEKEIRAEYLARAELAGVVSFWDDLAGTISKSTDVWKEMTEARIDRCIKLSKSTYEWLADGSKKTKLWTEGGGVERSEGRETELRLDMDRVAGAIYTKMITGDLDIWTTRGEDRWAMIEQIAEELRVSNDSVRLTWQVAEAECWQARMGVSFVSHPAVKVVQEAKFRDFRTRKLPDAPVPGGSRLWSEYLRKHKNTYPGEDVDVYGEEGRRLARVGFEAWIIRVSKDKDANGQPKDARFGKYRDGVVFLFSERKDGEPSSLLRDALAETDLVTVNQTRGLKLRVDESRVNVRLAEILSEITDQGKRERFELLAQNAVGGERALWSGEYFSQSEALLKQPGLLEVDLPQTVTMNDLSKAAGVFEAIESFGKIDATKATTDELAKLRNALTSQYFRFQSNDLKVRTPEDKVRTIVMFEGTPQENAVNWKIESGVTERMARARILAGQYMEQWARSYVWLLSWANPANEESRVVGMRDWILLARDVARDWDEQRQWGQFVGYGYGNYDKNELAVKEDGKTQRRGATEESKRAARGFVEWFETMRKVNKEIVVGKKRRMSDARWEKDSVGLGTYVPGFFWTKTWW